MRKHATARPYPGESGKREQWVEGLHEPDDTDEPDEIGFGQLSTNLIILGATGGFRRMQHQASILYGHLGLTVDRHGKSEARLKSVFEPG